MKHKEEFVIDGAKFEAGLSDWQHLIPDSRAVRYRTKNVVGGFNRAGSPQVPAEHLVSMVIVGLRARATRKIVLRSLRDHAAELFAAIAGQ